MLSICTLFNLGALQYNCLTLYSSLSLLHLGLDNGQLGSTIRENVELEIYFVGDLRRGF